MWSVGNLSCMVIVVRSLGFGCSRRTLSVLVLSTCPLYPRDETVLPPLRIPGWRWLGGWIFTRKCNGEHESSGSGSGPALFLHQDCPRSPAAYPLEVLGRSLRGGLRSCFSCYAARRAQVGRLERNDNYFYYIIMLCYLFNIIDFFLLYDCVIHVSTTSIAWMVWHGGWASAHQSSDRCYPLCALVTLVLRLIGFTILVA